VTLTYKEHSLKFAFVLLLLPIFLPAGAFGRSRTQHPPSSSAKQKPGRPTGIAEAVHRNNLGVAYMNQQQFARAYSLFRQATVLDPQLEAAKVNQGIALAYQQKYQAAGILLNAVITKTPNQAHAWYVLGLVLKNAGDSEKALHSFSTAARLAPGDPDVFYFIGLVQSELGKQQAAIAAFQHALELNPFHASAEFGLARSLQRLGRGEEAREHLGRFQHLVQSKLGAPMSLAYGDQGPLSLALPSANPGQPSAKPIPVHFLDVTADSGLTFSSPAHTSTQTDQAGAGACLLDFDDDGLPDLFLADGGPEGGLALLHNKGHGKFEDVTKRAGLDPKLHAIACAAADYDNDGHTDLAFTSADRVLLFHNQGDAAFRNISDAVQVPAQSSPLAVAFIDYDHDGDLDLFVTSKQPGKNAVLRNNGNGTFTDVTQALGLAGDTATFGVLATDFNNDRATDLIFAAQHPQLFLNPREGKWSRSPLWNQSDVAPVNAAISLDWNKDGWMDIALAHDGAPGITLWRNQTGKTINRVELPVKNWRRAWGLAALDYDNDGWLDLAAIGETEDGGAEVRLFRNLGNNGFQDVTSQVGLDAIKLVCPCALLAADIDGDGGTDLLITQLQRSPVLLHNTGSTRNNFLRVSLQGLVDNKSAVGAKVEVFAGMQWQKWETTGLGYLSQSATPLVVGLGKERRVDAVRVLWPTGVVQDEAPVAANTGITIKEMDRRGSSCPVLFVWDGTRYRFIADMIGAGAVGHWVGPGERNVPDSTEYMKVEGTQVRRKGGRLSFRFMEPLEEVVYLDQVRLLAVDHPRDLDVYPNEYFASAPPFPEFKVIASRNALPPTGAWDEKGNQFLERLRSRDRSYVGNFDLLPYKGFTRSHTLEIQLPEPYRGGPLRLLLYGYTEYFTANSMYAGWQGGVDPVAPYLEALGPDGKWIVVVRDMGFPAGLPRTIVSDLTDKLPHGAQRLRITTNLQIYWDQILIDTTPDPANLIQVTEAPLSRAQLAFHGYPRLLKHRSPGDFEFVYDDVSQTGPFARPVGAYTRLGDVRDLLLSRDDRFVIFGSGDEVQLDFDPALLPPLPRNWKRDYFFFVDGFEKDMDFYAAEGDFVGPLPFHAMGRYPDSGKDYPQDEVHINDLLNYHTRFFSGLPSASYRFHYPRRSTASRRCRGCS
jgi:tetratricopeptide (TPR) repeat protein